MEGQLVSFLWDTQNLCIDGAFQLWITRNLIRILKAFCRSLEEICYEKLETALGGEIWTFLIQFQSNIRLYFLHSDI